jgi:Tfp pilus assembly protein PilF
MRVGILFLFAAVLPAFAADQWIRLTTPHFELYTTEGEKRGRQAVLYFEEVRSFFSQAAPVRGGVTDFPVRIIVFKNEKQYTPYRLNSVAFAYYTASQNRDYIVMQDSDEEHFPVAIHEFMHLIVRHSGLNLPLWLNEGWADVYSTLKPSGKSAKLGDLVPGYPQTLLTGKWLSFDALTAVDHKSAEYNESKRAGIFYAESWALVHMLYLAPDYKRKFVAFVSAVLNGKTAAEACQIAYGKPASEVYADLRQYLDRKMLYGALLPAQLSKSEEEAESATVTDFDSDLVLADLLASIGKHDQAKVAYEKLAKTNPDKPEVERSLGYLVWQRGERAAAREYFEKAFAAGDEDPQMCYHLAMLEREARAPDDKVIPPLLRALKVRNDYFDARLQLAAVEMNAQNYAGALAAYVQLKNVPAEQAAMVLNGMAYAYAQTGNLAEARRQAEAARKWDKTDADIRQTDSVIRYVDFQENAAKRPARADTAKPETPQARLNDAPASESQPSEAPTLRRLAPRDDAASRPAAPAAEKLERVEGTAKSLDCSGKVPRFVVQVGQKTMSFELADPGKIVLKHEGEATFDFNCGPQKAFSVAIDYLPAKNGPAGVAGAVRRIEF